MPKLKLGPITGEKPVRITTELPAGVHRDLLAYADALARETGQTVEPTHVIAPMLARFMATDRAFAKLRRSMLTSKTSLPNGLPGVQPPLPEQRGSV